MEHTESRKPHTVPLWQRITAGVVLLFGVALGGGLLTLAILYFGIRPVLDWEYGAGIPEIAVFAPRRVASYIETPPIRPEIGTHRLRIEADGVALPVWLRVSDTRAPKADPKEQTISTRVVLRPDELIENLRDADMVKVSFLETPPFGTVGDYDVTVLLEDVSGNQSAVTAPLHIRMLSADSITIEAGEAAPTAADYLLDDYPDAALSEISEAMRRTPGVHPLTLTAGGMTHTVYLCVNDTVAPVVQAEMRFLSPDEPVSPEAFLTEVIDETATEASFLNAPNMEERDFQTVTIRVTDAGGNHTDVSTSLLLTHAQPVVLEARSTPMTAAELLPDDPEGAATARLIKEFVPDTVGHYAVSLLIDGEPELVLVEITDTTPPQLSGGTLTRYLNHPVPADTLVTATDVSPVVVTYDAEPDWTLSGEQIVSLTATDASGNAAHTNVRLSLVQDTEPPVLYGVKMKYFYVDEPYTYLEGVTAIDNADGEVAITVDTSEVPQNRTGGYFIRYTATDAAGNSTSLGTYVMIKPAGNSAAKLAPYIDRIVAKIFTDDMTLGQKVVAIYDYVYRNVTYAATSDKTDWRKEALRAVRKGRGDCFTSNCLARALLERTEAEVFPMQRKSYNSNHYWLLVNIGTGWYHFDATCSREHSFKCCMWTDAQCSIMGQYWGYEKNATPPVATERFSIEKAAAVEAEWVAAHPVGGNE